MMDTQGPMQEAFHDVYGPDRSTSTVILSNLWQKFLDWWHDSSQDPQQQSPSVPDDSQPSDAGLPGGLPDGGDGGDGSGGDESGGDGCFVGSTPVLMAGGWSKPICSVVVGDQVIARDEDTGEKRACIVTKTFRHVVSSTLVLHLEAGGEVETTAVHRFASKGKFISADELRPGDGLSTHGLEEIKLISISRQSDEAVVYNLSVEGYHTYFVGETGLWVHNKKKVD
jgi:hypothetical protein